MAAPIFGPSGVPRERIEHGDHIDVFASADMDQPRRLARTVPLPPALTVGPAYGLIVLTDQPLAARFALFVLSEQGQTILQRHRFDPTALP
jgi:ABC-type molybdate transport system substrate-binding protein